MVRLFFPALILLLIISCQSHTSQEENPLIKEAFGYYTQSDSIHIRVEAVLDSLENAVRLSGKPADDPLSIRLNGLKETYEAWEENFFEVPGFGHKHEGHDHHHEHKTAPQVTPEQMVEIQKEILSNIRKIDSTLSTIR